MATLRKVLLVLPILFLAVQLQVDAKRKKQKKAKKKYIVPIIGVGFPFPGFNEPDPPADEQQLKNPGGHDDGAPAGKPDLETQFPGHWEIVNQESGVSAMHINLLPTNKLIIYDTTTYHVSRLKLPVGVPCLPFEDLEKNPQTDCWAHSMIYDIETNQVIPIRVETDFWCSSGGLAPDGTFVSSGGFLSGGKVVRYMAPCADGTACAWKEQPNAFKEERWYPTQTILPNGEFIVVGGRRSFSYEFVPKEGQLSEKPYFFPFLYETSDIDENNLYPFVHLIPDGNLFIFSNNRSLLLNPATNKIIRTFPVLPGGSRNYPASGMSALLPIKLNDAAANAIQAEVIVCGGNTPDAFNLAEVQKKFLPALQDCARMIVTDPNPQWEIDNMPSRRTMGDLLNLPNGQLLFLNGAQKGTAAWWDADDPNFTPILYSPEKPRGERFKELKPTQIARMYHSTSAVLPSGKIWVGGSNTHDTYRANDRFPTETRIEHFSPPYLDVALANFRPEIVEATSAKELNYGAHFEIAFTVKNNAPLEKNDIKVTMYFPPFTTHGFSMSQRLLVLASDNLNTEAPGNYKVVSVAPPSGNVAPPGYYLLFIVHRGVPSKGMWVHIQ